jgi:putative endonuclease
MNTKEIGDFAEELALEYLCEKGYTLRDRKYRYGQMGEVDLVMIDGSTVVFVEVRHRTSTMYGTPEESLRPGKLRKIRRTALAWLTVHGCTKLECRFDVVAVDLVGGTPVLRHLLNAF